jgi:hypothetical protein
MFKCVAKLSKRRNALPAFADKPSWAGGNKHNKKEKQENRHGEEQYYDAGSPDDGYRFVCAASDILMITTGTGMVMDAILDLGGM